MGDDHMRSFTILAAVAALAFATAADAANGGSGNAGRSGGGSGGYHLSATGKCLDGAGRKVAASYCHPSMMSCPAGQQRCGGSCIPSGKVCRP
jgi:hypothetical protein